MKKLLLSIICGLCSIDIINCLIEFKGQLKVSENEEISNKLTIGDSLRCSVDELDPVPNFYDGEVRKTLKSNTFTFFEFPKTKKESLTFAVRSPSEVTVSIANAKKEDMIEIFLGQGIDPNIQSKFRRIYKNKKPNDSIAYTTKNIINENEFHWFWLDWENGKIRIGRDGDHLPIMTWNVTDMFVVNYIGIRTSRSDGEWIFKELNCPNGFHLNNTISIKCILMESLNLFPEIRFQRNLLHQIKSDFEDFIKTPKIRHTTMFIEKNLCELEENYSKAKELNDKILLNANINEKDLNNYLEEKVYNQIKEKYFDYHYNLYDKQSVWNISQNYGNFQTIPADMMTEGCFRFNTTNEVNEIYLNLQTVQNPNIEIFIGLVNSSISSIDENDQKLGIAFVETFNFNNKNDKSGFRIEWKRDGSFMIARDDELKSFLAYQIPKPVSVTSISVRIPGNGTVVDNLITENC